VWFALLIPLMVTAVADTTDRQTHTVALPEGRTLTVEVTVGSVRIDGWDRAEVEIAIERQVPVAADRARLPIVVDETPARVSVRAVQAAGGTDAALRVEIVIRVPRAALIERVQILEGRLVLNGFRGGITADLRRGPIDGTDVAGTLRLETGIGSVTLNAARLSAGGLLRLRTFNGDVRLRLAERPANARILALAMNGEISSTLPLTMKNSWGPRWGEVTIGSGEPLISLDVVSGTIEIRSP